MLGPISWCLSSNPSLAPLSSHPVPLSHCIILLGGPGPGPRGWVISIPTFPGGLQPRLCLQVPELRRLPWVRNSSLKPPSGFWGQPSGDITNFLCHRLCSGFQPRGPLRGSEWSWPRSGVLSAPCCSQWWVAGPPSLPGPSALAPPPLLLPVSATFCINT